MIQKTFLFIQFFFAFLGFGLALFSIGFVVFRLLKHKAQSLFVEVLRSVFLGYILLITAFSLVACRGVTINVVFVFPLIIGYFEFRRVRPIAPSTESKPSNWKAQTWTLILFVLFSFSWGFFGTISSTCDLLTSSLSSDYILYSKIAKTIVANGQENGFYYLNNLDAYYNGTDPYHYFDLWGAGIVAKTLNLNYYFSLRLIVYPLFYFLALLGFASMLTKTDVIGVSFCILLLFLSGAYFKFYDENEFLGGLVNFNFNLIGPNIGKLSFYYVFFLVAYLFHRQGFKSLALVCLLCLPVASIVTFPTVVSALCVLCVFGYFSDKRNKTSHGIALIYSITVALLIITFYSLFGRKAATLPGVEITNPIRVVLENLVNSDFKTQRNILVGGTAHLIILYMPLLLLSLAVRQRLIGFLKEDLAAIAFLFLTVAFGLMGWALLYRELNSFQLFSNISVPLLNFCSAIFVLRVFCSSYTSLPTRVFLCSTVVFLFIQVNQTIQTIRKNDTCSYTASYLRGVEEIVKANGLKIGLSIKDKGSLLNFHDKYTAVYPLGNYLELLNERIYVVNVGDFSTPIDSASSINLNRSVKAIKDGIFYRFVMQKYGQWPSPTEVDAATVEFADSLHADFILLSKNAQLPTGLLKRTTSGVTDTMSGERFFTITPTTR